MNARIPLNTKRIRSISGSESDEQPESHAPGSARKASSRQGAFGPSAANRGRQLAARSRRWSLIRAQRGARHQVDQARLIHALPISDTNPVRLSAILSTDSSGAIPSKQTIGQGGEFPLRSKATSSPAPLLPNTNKSGAICS